MIIFMLFFLFVQFVVDFVVGWIMSCVFVDIVFDWIVDLVGQGVVVFIEVDVDNVCVVVDVYDWLCVVGIVLLLFVGILVLVKDLFDVVGQVMCVGLCVFDGVLVVCIDVVVVVWFKCVGVVLVGCINMSEFVFLGFGLNLYFGNLCLLYYCDVLGDVWILGGLLLGVVVLVVDGMVVVVFGIDIGGLICILVVLCGFMGFKLIVSWILM